uniref:hypothetical protein n=1 Tax=Crenalkalicoccus roseus TaxID=1485588 RepID=UPI001081F1F2
MLLGGLLPIPLGYLGVIMKDTTLAVALLAAFGVAARFRLAGRSVPIWAWPALAALLAFAMLLRFNAPFAAVPLILYLLPDTWRMAPARRLALGAVLLAASLVLSQVASRALFRPEASDVRLSPIVYDLGGISRYSGRDHFPDLGIPDLAEMNRQRCYQPIWWDTYLWGECRLVFERFREVVREGEAQPLLLWTRAVTAEPLAYLRHRAAHANANLRFLLPYAREDVTFIETSDNPHGISFQPNALTLAIREAGLVQAMTPAGWPAAWLAVALGWLILAPALRPGPARALLLALALSALAYGSSYLVFSVASDLRYHLWTMFAAAMTSAIGLAEAARQAGGLPRLRLAAAASPATGVAATGLGPSSSGWNR